MVKILLKKNYKAWQVNPLGFSEKMSDSKKLLFFARYAILAPSGHNTQPWMLEADKKSIRVKINRSHYLSIDGSGLLSVEPYISIGTFLEVFNLAALGFGYKLNTHLFPRPQIVATISIKQKVKPVPELLEAITRRASNRNPFNKSKINENLMAEIISNDFKDIDTKIISKRSDIEFVSDETKSAVESIMSKPEYREELSRWVRTNQTRKYDGMPGFTHGFGNIKSLASKVAVKKGMKLGPQAEHSKELILASSALVIVSCTENNNQAFINAGRNFSKVCVLATKNGLASSALGASAIDPETRERLKKRFKIKGRPVYVLRLGKSKVTAHHSPRYPLESTFVPEMN